MHRGKMSLDFYLEAEPAGLADKLIWKERERIYLVLGLKQQGKSHLTELGDTERIKFKRKKELYFGHTMFQMIRTMLLGIVATNHIAREHSKYAQLKLRQ